MLERTKRWLVAAALGMCVSWAALSSAGCDSLSSVRADERLESAGGEPVTRQPLQIGKLIKKRQIAPVMSVAHADWLTRPERDAEEQPDRVVAALNIPKGATVVDLGAGVGYFTWRLARQVGPSGRVIAQDIQPGMIELLRENLKERGITNVEIVLGTPEDPHLPVGEADLVLLVDVYHELAFPQKTMEHVRRALKPDGRVVIIEYRKEDPDIPISPLHKMTVEELRSEVEPVGYRLAEVMDFLPAQHIAIFKDSRRRN